MTTKTTPTVAITDAFVLAAPRGSETQDKKRPTLRLVVSPLGKRVWRFYGWVPAHKKVLKKTLGLAGDGGLTVKAARAAVDALLADARTRPAKSGVPTFAAVVDVYCSPWVKREFDRYLKPWRELALDKLTRDAVEARERFILAEAGYVSRTRNERAGKPVPRKPGVHSVTSAAKAIRFVYKVAATRRLYAGLDMGQYMTVTPVEPRLRVLSRAEEARFFAALDSPALTPWVRPFFRLLYESGARWGNVAAARFEEIDLDDAAWTVPAAKSKNGRPMRILLSDAAVEVVRKLQEENIDASPWLFPNERNRMGHLGDIQYMWQRLKGLADLDGLTPHDIRRSYGSKLISRNVSLDIVAAMMGHKSSSTTQKYYGHVQDYAKREALKLLAN